MYPGQCHDAKRSPTQTAREWCESKKQRKGCTGFVATSCPLTCGLCRPPAAPSPPPLWPRPPPPPPYLSNAARAKELPSTLQAAAASSTPQSPSSLEQEPRPDVLARSAPGDDPGRSYSRHIVSNAQSGLADVFDLHDEDALVIIAVAAALALYCAVKLTRACLGHARRACCDRKAEELSPTARALPPRPRPKAKAPTSTLPRCKRKHMRVRTDDEIDEWTYGPICNFISETIVFKKAVPASGKLGMWGVAPQQLEAAREQIRLALA